MTSQLSDRSQSEAGACPAVETRWLDAEEQKVWRAWLYSSSLLRDRLDRELTHETGISHAYYEILVALSEAPERAMRMSELADRCLSSRSRLSHAASPVHVTGVRTHLFDQLSPQQVENMRDIGETLLRHLDPDA